MCDIVPGHLISALTREEGQGGLRPIYTYRATSVYSDDDYENVNDNRDDDDYRNNLSIDTGGGVRGG